MHPIVKVAKETFSFFCGLKRNSKAVASHGSENSSRDGTKDPWERNKEGDTNLAEEPGEGNLLLHLPQQP